MMRKLGCAGRQPEARAGGGAPCVEETLPARSQALATGAIVGAPSVRLQLAIVAKLHRLVGLRTLPHAHGHTPTRHGRALRLRSEEYCSKSFATVGLSGERGCSKSILAV